MSLFECERCHCVENTATGSYWGQEKKLCSECATGEWHGVFPKRPAAGMLKDERGMLWSKAQVDGGALPPGLEIVGVVET